MHQANANWAASERMLRAVLRSANATSTAAGRCLICRWPATDLTKLRRHKKLCELAPVARWLCSKTELSNVRGSMPRL